MSCQTFRLTHTLHTRVSTVTFMGVLAVAIIIAVCNGRQGTMIISSGILFETPTLWFTNSWLSAAISFAVICLVAVATVVINRTFNVLRSLTALGATIFLALEAATPAISTRFGGGIFLTITMLVCLALLFSTFSDNTGQRRVFMIFLVTVTASLWQGYILFFIPVLLIGCAQMRILSLRGLLAALLGIITPIWILAGCNLLGIADLHPHIPTPALADIFDRAQWPSMACTLFTILIAIVFMTANLMKILGYNSRVRAFNGFFTILLIYTILLIAIDSADYLGYLPLLNLLTAYQIAHFFTYRRYRRSYIPILAIILCYAGFYLWHTI